MSAEANLPHTSGSFGVEVRPFRRLRIVESWLTDRLHNASSSSASQIITPPPATQPPLPAQNAALVSNYSQEQVDLFLELSKKLTVRGGYRYVWGDASTLVLPVAGLLVPDSGQLRRNIGIGGFSFRPNQKIVVSGEVEAASSGQIYFRTSLNTYQKAHARARYQALQNLTVSADFSLLNNQNPTPSIQNDYLARQNSVSFLWVPQGGKRVTLQGDYTRATIRSNILLPDPSEFAACAVHLSGQCAFRYGFAGLRLAHLWEDSAKAVAGRLLAGLVRKPAHQLLSAYGEAGPADLAACGLGVGMAILRFRRSFLRF